MDKEKLRELLVEQIRNLYDGEKQIVKALPTLAEAAESQELAEALRTHLEQTQTHVSRLKQVFLNLEIPEKGKSCKGMQGLLAEGSETANEQENGVLRDLAIIAGCQKVEHYEISAYGTARTLAEQLDNDDVVELLEETETEEKLADEKLTEIATNLYAASDEQDEDEQEMAASSSYTPEK